MRSLGPPRLFAGIQVSNAGREPNLFSDDPISLAFEKQNLRWNPFGEPAAEEMAALAVVEVEQYVERLRQPGFAVPYLGEAGRGKSTHLRALHRFFPAAPYLKFPENTKIPKIPHAPVLFLDETQRLPPRLRRRIFFRKGSFVIGTHEDHSAELSRAGIETASIRLSGLSPERLAEIIERRLEWARRGPGPLPQVSAAEIDRLIATYDDNLSAILGRLYDEFQTLEAGGKDGDSDHL
jgi:hypothetical protein